jgi:dephospho-CoA kinase
MTPGERFHEPRARARWRHGTTPVIGLIGGVASGKSAVAALLADRGFTTIDADRVGHEVLDLPDVQQKLVNRFGTAVVVGHSPSGTEGPQVDRRALATIVFPDPEARRALEAIVHPLMRVRFAQAIDRAIERAPRGVVLDAAILFEAGWNDLCDLVVFVDSPRSERMHRAATHRGWSEAVFDSREQAQWPCEDKRRLAAFIIRNDAGPDSLRREVEALIAAPGFLGADLPTSAGPEPQVSLSSSQEESAARAFLAPRVEGTSGAARGPVRNGEDGTGSDAWQGPCLVL